MDSNKFNIKDIRGYMSKGLDNKVYVLSMVLASSLFSCSLGLFAYNNIEMYQRKIDRLFDGTPTYRITITEQKGKKRFYLDEQDYPYRTLINTDRGRYNLEKGGYIRGKIFLDVPENKGVRR